MPLGGALAIGGVSAIANLFGSKNASKAAKSAAQQQEQAINNAQGIIKNTFQGQQQAIQPYQQAGQYALSNLMAKQYGGVPNQYNAPSNYGVSTAGMAPQPGTQNMNPGAVGMQSMPGVGFNLANLRQSTNPAAGMPGTGINNPPMQQPLGGAQGMVLVQAPTGETRRMSAAMAQQAVSRGAQIIQ